MTAPKPLIYLVQAERRIKCVEPRDFSEKPWMTGEDVTFFTPARIAEMAAANEKLRVERKKRSKPCG